MNPIRRQLLNGQRQLAAAAAADTSTARDEPVHIAADLRRGLATIGNNVEDGEYTITEKWWNPETEVWDDATAPLGLSGATAYDWKQRPIGVAGQTVRFWQVRTKEGETRTLIDAAAPLMFAKVTNARNASDGVWTDYKTDGFQSHCRANPCDSAGGNPVAAVTLQLKLTDDPADAIVGFMDVSAGDVVAYTVGDENENVPGTAGASQLDGYVIAHPGTDGAWENIGRPDEANTFSIALSKVDELWFDRSGRLVKWTDFSVPANTSWTKNQTFGPA